MLKRDLDDVGSSSTKRVRYEDDQTKSSSLIEYTVKSGALIATEKVNIPRKSSLSNPTMQLAGHEGAVYSISLDPYGQHLASSSLDRNIFLWNVYGDCENYNVLSGHKGAVLQVEWSSNPNHIMSCSADKTVSIWDANKGQRIRKFAEHEGIVNCLSVASKNPNIFASGSDDFTVKIWDSRCKWAVQSIDHEYQVTAVSITDDGNFVYSGGIDNVIRRWDLSADTGIADLTLEGHQDTITGLSLSPDGGHYLLSNAMDSSLRKWDVRPFAHSDNRCVMMYEGVHHGAEKGLLRCSWSGDSDYVTSGSADRIVHIWDSLSGKPLYYLPGHKGSVNQVIFHQQEQIIISCSSDKTIYIGELFGENE